MTKSLARARQILKPLGLTITYNIHGEYRVAWSSVEFIKRWGTKTSKTPEDSAYYTNDLEDAVLTGQAMFREAEKFKGLAYI